MSITIVVSYATSLMVLAVKLEPAIQIPEFMNSSPSLVESPSISINGISKLQGKGGSMPESLLFCGLGPRPRVEVLEAN